MIRPGFFIYTSGTHPIGLAPAHEFSAASEAFAFGLFFFIK